MAIIFAACAMRHSGTANADDAELRTSLISAIETTWGPSPDLAKAAKAQFAAIDRMAPGEPRALYGYALVLMSQRNYDEALRILDRLLADDESHLPAWRAKIWIATLKRNFGAALAACDRSTAALAELEDEDLEASSEHLRFVGRALGFMEGPAAEATGTASRDDIEKKILARLPEHQRAEIAEAKEELLVRFSEFTSARDDSKAIAKAEADETKEKLLQDVAEARVENEKRADGLQQKRDKLASEYDAEMEKLEAQDAPLRSQLAAIEAQIVAEQSNLAIVNADIARLQIVLSRERDPVLRRAIQFDIDRVAITATRIQANIFSLDRQIGGVNSQRANLASRQQSVQNRLGGQVNQIDRELAAIGKAEKKLDGSEKQINKPVSLNKGKALALNTKAAAWTTYQPFPLLDERERLVSSLR